MARRCLYYIFLIYVLVGCEAIQLPADKGTQRPRLKATTFTTTTTTTTTTKPAKDDDSGIVTYRLINRVKGNTCILLKTDAVVEVKFQQYGIEAQADSFIPDTALVVGDCNQEEYVKMSIIWQSYSLSLSFAKTPGGEHWYLSYVDLTVSVDIPQFHGLTTRDKTLRLYNTSMVMPTPVGRSYLCDDEVDIDLKTDPADHPPSGVRGTLLLRALQVQAFMYRSENFSSPYECKAQRSFRSETAPIAVGSTLAIAALLIVTLYAAYRYFKVKNVKYNTME